MKRSQDGITLGPLSLAIRRGEVLAVIGPPGSGKTTLLRMLWGFVRPDEGSIAVLGKTPHLQQVDLRRRVGYVSASPSFSREMTAVTYLESVSGFYPTWNWERAKALVRSFGIDTSKRLEDLPAGSLRNLGIASALTHRPELLLLDEPAGELDPPTRKDVLDRIRQFASEENTAVILSSKDADDLERVADSTIVLNSRTPVWSGSDVEYPILRQTGKNDCGPTCLAMVSAYFGNTHSVRMLSELAETKREGTSLAGMIRAAAGIGLASRGVRISEDEFDRVPLPVIAHWNENGRNHYVVVWDASGGVMTIGDPAVGLREIAGSDFRSCWTGILLLVSPKPDGTTGK